MPQFTVPVSVMAWLYLQHLVIYPLMSKLFFFCTGHHKPWMRCEFHINTIVYNTCHSLCSHYSVTCCHIQLLLCFLLLFIILFCACIRWIHVIFLLITFFRHFFRTLSFPLLLCHPHIFLNWLILFSSPALHFLLLAQLHPHFPRLTDQVCVCGFVVMFQIWHTLPPLGCGMKHTFNQP